jgi:hypothetical protein
VASKISKRAIDSSGHDEKCIERRNRAQPRCRAVDPAENRGTLKQRWLIYGLDQYRCCDEYMSLADTDIGADLAHNPAICPPQRLKAESEPGHRLL